MSEDTQVARTERNAPERVEEGPTFTPQVDIVQTPDSIVVLADLPGVAREDLDVTLENGVLTIAARPVPQKSEGLELDYAEYAVGSFYRRFTLGRGLDAGSIDATLKDGVLRLEIPKTDHYRRRRIEIAGG